MAVPSGSAPGLEPGDDVRASVFEAAWGGLRASFMLMTRLPVGTAPLSIAARRWAAAWFPLVGAVVGAAGAAVFAGVHARLGGFLAATLALSMTAALTGALHEDGLADTADALGGARDRERLFAILKDSRIGTYGALTLMLGLLLRIGALDRLADDAPSALLLASVLPRFGLVWLMATLPYVTPSAVSRSADVARAGRGALMVAHALTAALLAAGIGMGALSLRTVVAALVAVALCLGLAGWRFRARAGGITGDFLGAAEQVGEVAVLLTCLLVGRR